MLKSWKPALAIRNPDGTVWFELNRERLLVEFAFSLVEIKTKMESTKKE
jgi:hypothetical protein